MEAEFTCIYAKYGKCKKEDCKFHHPKDICSDKTCEIHFCSKKHPRHCRYFWGFNACRNEETCKFLHGNAPIHTDEALAVKYDKLAVQYKNLENRCSNYNDEIEKLKEQLEQQIHEIYVLRCYVFPEDSHNDSIFNLSHDVTSQHDDEKDKEAQIVMEESTDIQKENSDMEQENNDEQLKTVKVLSDNTSQKLPKNDYKINILNIDYLESEIIKIKDFVSSEERMVAKRVNETRQKLKTLNNEIKTKFGKTGSEKKLKNKLETLSEKVMKIKTNFKKSVGSELEICAEMCREEKVKIENKCLLTTGR